MDAPISIRPFIGSKNYALSRSFYKDLGFEEMVLNPTLCLFQKEDIGFYLQDAYVKDWIDNTMVFVEVKNIENYWEALSALQLQQQYPGVKLSSIQYFHWGSEIYLHDPCGILWHFGQFKKS